MLDGAEWGEFKLEELFDISHYGKQRSKADLQKNGAGKYNFVMQNEKNNGVAERVPEQVGNDFNLIPGNSISAFTHLNKVYYQEEPFYSKQGSNVYTLRSNFLNKNSAFFIVSAINSAIGEVGYGKNTASRLKSYIVSLPIKETKIDFEFMENFAKEVEAERLAVVDAHLSKTKLKDCQLTPEEKKALGDYNSLEFEDFKLIDVFNVKNSGNILSRDVVEDSGDTPYLCASKENNSISSYISYDKNYLDKGNCVFIGGKTFVVTYQEKDFYSNDSHNLILYVKNEENTSKLNQLYLATCVNKSLKHKYSWGDSISNRKIQKDMVSLPAKNNKPDFSSMELLMSAVQKLVIKDVVDYLNSKVAAS